MLKELVQYLEQRPAPVFEDYGGKRYSDKELYPVTPAHPAGISTTTLRSVADYINNGVDDKTDFPLGRIIVHIERPSEVNVISESQKDGSRWERIRANAVVANVPFGQFIDNENFNILLQTEFIESAERSALLQMIGSLYDESSLNVSDDGVAQKVTLRTGIQRLSSSEVPNPITLSPRRTFPEIEQPKSPFVLRLRKSRTEGKPPEAALFESDGTAWRLEAVENIRKYFESVLDDKKLKNGEIVILA